MALACAVPAHSPSFRKGILMTQQPTDFTRALLTISVTAVVGFLYFSAWTALLSHLGPGRAVLEPIALATRVAAAIAVSVALYIAERRRENPSLGSAVGDGFQLAVIVVLFDVLFVPADAGQRLALRTLAVLVGLPGLWSLTYFLVRRPGAGAAGVAGAR